MRYNFTTSEWLKFGFKPNLVLPNVSKVMGQPEFFYIAARGMKWLNYFGKLTEILLLCFYPVEIQISTHEITYMIVYIIIQTRNNSNVRGMEEQMVVYSHDGT